MARYPQFGWQVDGGHVTLYPDTALLNPYWCWPFFANAQGVEGYNYAAMDRIAGWDFIIIPFGAAPRPDIVNYLKSKNPACKVLYWMSGGRIYQGSTHDPDATHGLRDPNHTAYDDMVATGSTTSTLGGGTWPKAFTMSARYLGTRYDYEAPGAGHNYSNSGLNFCYTDAVTAYANAIINNVFPYCDGVFFDYCFVDGRANTSQLSYAGDHRLDGTMPNADCMDFTQQGFTQDVTGATLWWNAYKAGHRLFMQLLRAGGAGKFIIGNSGGSADATEMASMSGDMIEWFPTQGGAGGQTEDVAWQTNMFGDGHGHLGVFAIDAGITATPNLSFLTGDGWPGTDYYYWTVGPPWLQYARYQAASVSLIDHWCSSFGGTPPIGTRNPPDDLRYNKWPPEMSVDVVTGLSHAASYDISFTGWLGQPLAPYSVVSGVYVRFFEHGCCAINPTSVAKNFTPGVTPTGQAFRRITSNISGDTVNVGGTVGTYSVPAYDAIFLLGDPPDQHAEHSIERAKNTVRLSHRVGAVSMTSIGGSVGMIRTKGGG